MVEGPICQSPVPGSHTRKGKQHTEQRPYSGPMQPGIAGLWLEDEAGQLRHVCVPESSRKGELVGLTWFYQEAL